MPAEPPARWPVGTLIIEGPKLARPHRLRMEQKYGVWFFLGEPPAEWRREFPARGGGTDPVTLPFIELLCHRHGYTWRWLEPVASSRPEAPTGVL